MDGKKILFETFSKMIQENEYQDISVKTLVASAAVNRNTFYYHFMDMDSFLEEYLDYNVFYEIRKNIMLEQYNESFFLTISYAENHKIELKSLLGNSSSDSIINKLIHTNIRMDIQKKLYDLAHKLKLFLPDEFMLYFAHTIAEEYLRAIKQIVLDNTNPDMIRKIIVLYVEAIPDKLIKVSKLRLQ